MVCIQYTLFVFVTLWAILLIEEMQIWIILMHLLTTQISRQRAVVVSVIFIFSLTNISSDQLLSGINNCTAQSTSLTNNSQPVEVTPNLVASWTFYTAQCQVCISSIKVFNLLFMLLYYIIATLSIFICRNKEVNPLTSSRSIPIILPGFPPC